MPGQPCSAVFQQMDEQFPQKLMVKGTPASWTVV
jgi:hypothetical protein